MGEPNKRVEDLLARVSKTTAARYRAGDRSESQRRLSQWTLALLALSLVFVALLQAMGVASGLPPTWMHAAQAVMAVLLLLYAVLIGTEKFVSQAGSMRRSGIELDRLSRRIAARDPNKMSEAEYAAFLREYFDILDKYEHHLRADCLFARLSSMPKKGGEWPAYTWLWLRLQLGNLFRYLHYGVVLGFVGVVLFMLLTGVVRHARSDMALELRSSERLGESQARVDRLTAESGRRR